MAGFTPNDALINCWNRFKDLPVSQGCFSDFSRSCLFVYGIFFLSPFSTCGSEGEKGVT